MIKYILILVIAILITLISYTYLQQETNNNLRKTSLEKNNLPIEKISSVINEKKSTPHSITKADEQMVPSEFLNTQEIVDYETEDITSIDDTYYPAKKIEDSQIISDKEMKKNEKMIISEFLNTHEGVDADYEEKDITSMSEDEDMERITQNADKGNIIIESDVQMKKNEEFIIKEFLDTSDEIAINYETEDKF